MLTNFLRSVLAAALVASIADAQSRTLIVPVTSNDPAVQSMQAEVNMQNQVNDETFVYFVAQASNGYPFGNGTWAYVDSYGFTPLGYEWSNWRFYLNVVGSYPWGALAGGIGNENNLLFTLAYDN